MRELLEQFKEVSKKRTRLRKQIINIMRQKRNIFANDERLLRKMRLNYMGDLTDPKLMKYLEVIIIKHNRI